MATGKAAAGMILNGTVGYHCMKETTDSLHQKIGIVFPSLFQKKKIGIVRVNWHLKILLNYELSPTAESLGFQ